MYPKLNSPAISGAIGWIGSPTLILDIPREVGVDSRSIVVFLDQQGTSFIHYDERKLEGVKMKSLFAILSAMILALVLVACGGQTTESTTPTEEAATTEEPAAEEPMAEEPAAEEPMEEEAVEEEATDEEPMEEEAEEELE